MIFKVTEYFKYTRNRPDRVEIRDDWILKVITQPIKVVKQSDGRYKNGHI